VKAKIIWRGQKHGQAGFGLRFSETVAVQSWLK
jgi:hypothetical protein